MDSTPSISDSRGADTGGKSAQSAQHGHSELMAACYAALCHVRELEDAWMRGAIRFIDGRGGERFNRNIEVREQILDALRKEMSND